ncbi:hypothetical protein [Caulobacter sp. DWP3-1-3b2]|uniref:hypothetical protein n=1 Tax=Caulobacter sp. DWP3-1-3b2 TaxID=2804643 RepID=UPI003CE87D87
MTAAQLALHRNDRRESKALVVMISVLQLALVVLAWLLAVVPVALLALGVMTAKAVRAAFRPSTPTARAPSGVHVATSPLNALRRDERIRKAKIQPQASAPSSPA